MATTRSLILCVAFVIAVNVCVFCLSPLTGQAISKSKQNSTENLARLNRSLSSIAESSRNGKDFAFQRKPETSHVDCRRVLLNDKAYTKAIAANRPVLRDRKLDMSCEAIRFRALNRRNFKKLAFGVAHLRIVYQNYQFLEDEFISSYHPQNVFCYSVDAKAAKDFNDNIKSLSKCFPNVVYTKDRFPVTSSGHFMSHATYECFKLLTHFSGWRYVLIFQNYDVMTKTAYEMVSILQTYGGANDIYAREADPRRWNHTLKWDAKALKMFRDALHTKPTQLTAKLKMAIGHVETSLSRAAVDWMVKTLDLTTLINQLNNNNLYGIDELFMATLQVTEALEMPGGFTAKCIQHETVVPSFVKLVFWRGNPMQKYCQSKKWRHSVCIFGIEDFKTLATTSQFLANKVLPFFDYAVVDCLHEVIFNRTYLGQVDYDLNLDLYRKHAPTLYRKNLSHPDPNFKLNCSAFPDMRSGKEYKYFDLKIKQKL